jgi:hypothetical protein
MGSALKQPPALTAVTLWLPIRLSVKQPGRIICACVAHKALRCVRCWHPRWPDILGRKAEGLVPDVAVVRVPSSAQNDGSPTGDEVTGLTTAHCRSQRSWLRQGSSSSYNCGDEEQARSLHGNHRNPRGASTQDYSQYSATPRSPNVKHQRRTLRLCEGDCSED